MKFFKLNFFQKISLVNKVIKAVKIIEDVLEKDEYKSIADKASVLVEDVKKKVPETKELLNDIKELFV